MNIMDKGIHISIEAVAVLIIVIIVLVVLIAFFMGIFPPTTFSMKCKADFNVECERFRLADGCKKDEIFYNDYEYKEQLENATKCYLGMNTIPSYNDVITACCG